MKIMVLIGALCLLFVGLVSAQEAKDSIDWNAMQQEMMALAQPGPEHELLKSMVGSWKETTHFWMQPGTDPMVMESTMENEMILGDRFLLSNVTGEGAMGGDRLGLWGFDRRSGEYTTIGLDTWGTYYVTAKGMYDETSKTITMTGEDYEPTAGFLQTYKMILTFVSDDEMKFELIFTNPEMTYGQDEFKMVEARYTRADDDTE